MSIRVGLVRTDASCVRQMGYLAIFFCVFSSVLLASLRFCPPKDANRTQKLGFASYLRRIVLVNSVDLFLEPKGLLRASTDLPLHKNTL